jgi:hypothetical protein
MTVFIAGFALSSLNAAGKRRFPSADTDGYDRIGAKR